MALPTYSTGTASVAAGGTVVTGVGGMWSGTNVKQGDFISIGGSDAVLITEVTDATHLKVSPWPDAAKTSQPYIIYQNYVGRVVGVAAAEDIGDMLEMLHVDGLPFIVGLDETVPDPSYGDDGQMAFDPQTGQWWTKTGGAWVATSGLSGDFTQAGTGAVTRSMQDKARDIVSVKDFGAVGNGIADDRAAIQAAFNSVPRPGAAPPSTSPFTKPRATVFIPAGIYNVGASLVLPSGVSLQIDFGATIRASAAMTVVLTTAQTDYLDQHNESMIYGGGTVDANGLADHAIWLKYFADFFIENISTYQANVSHIRLGSQTAPSGSYGAFIKDCLLRRDLTAFPANLVGVFFDACGDSHIENTDIMGVKHGVASTAVGLGGCFDSKFDRVHIWNPALGGNSATVALTSGFAVQGSENIFTQCQVDGPFVSGGAGFHCINPRNQLIGCSVNSFGSHLLASGVFYEAGAGVGSIISGCTFKGASGSDQLTADVAGNYNGTTFTGNGAVNCATVVSNQLRLNGQLIQSGTVSTTPTAGTTAVTFPVAFSAAPIVTATMLAAPSTTATEMVTVGSIGTTGFNGYPRSINGTAGPVSSNSFWKWIAIGPG